MVAMELVVLWQGFAKHYGGGGKGCAKDRVWLPSHPSLYIGGRGEGADPYRWI